MHGFVERLLLRSELSDEEQSALLSLPFRERVVSRGRDLRRFGEPQTMSTTIVEGALARFGQNRDGGRQFVVLHLPSDMADLCSIILPDAAFGLQAVADTRVREISHAKLLAVARAHRGIADAFWRDCVADSSLIAQQVVRVGSLDAHARLANLLCEVACRLGASAEAPIHEFSFPLTQDHLGELLGITAVHINRMVRALREEKLAIMAKSTVTILDWSGLMRAGEFNPAYLQLGHVSPATAGSTRR